MTDLDFDAMFSSMVAHLLEIVVSVVPDVERTDMYIVGTQNKREMHLHFHNMEQEHVGLFLGRHKRNLEMIFAWLRAQQVCPGDRYIHINVHTPEGRTQKFYNGDLYSKKKNKKEEEVDPLKPVE